MRISAAQFFGADGFTGCRFDERRTGKENRALTFDDDALLDSVRAALNS